MKYLFEVISKQVSIINTDKKTIEKLKRELEKKTPSQIIISEIK